MEVEDWIVLWLAGWLMRGWVLSRVREEDEDLSDGIRVEIVTNI